MLFRSRYRFGRIRRTPEILAGAEGFEPPSSVLETDSLTVELTPLLTCHPEATRFSSPKDLGAPRDVPRFLRHRKRALGALPYFTSLFHFFVRRMLAAPAAELFQLYSVRRRFAVLRCRIVPLFAITAL